MIEKKYWRLNKNWGAGSCVWGERLESCQTSPDLLLGIICFASFSFVEKTSCLVVDLFLLISVNISKYFLRGRVYVVSLRGWSWWKYANMFCRQGFERSCKGFMLQRQDECRILFIRNINRSSHQKDDQRCKKKQIKICFSSTDFNALAKALQRLTNWKSIRRCKCLKLQSCVTIFIIFDQS